MASQLCVGLVLLIAVCTTPIYAYNKYGRTCADIGCTTSEVCVMAEDPCDGYSNECGRYPTCQRKANAVSSCETFICPPTTFCRLDGATPKCIPENGPLGGKNGNPYANIDPHSISNNNNGHGQPSAPLYPQIPPRGQTTTRSPIHRPNNGYNGGGYQGGAIGSGYPGQPSNGGGGYGGGTIGGGYPGGYSGYPGQSTNNNRYPAYPSSNVGGGGYPNSGYNGGSSGNPYNSNPYYASNNNNRYGYGSSGATTSNPLYDSIKDTLKSIGIVCFLVHALFARLRQV